MAAGHQAEGAGQQQQSRDNDGEKDAVHGTQRSWGQEEPRPNSPGRVVADRGDSHDDRLQATGVRKPMPPGPRPFLGRPLRVAQPCPTIQSRLSTRAMAVSESTAAIRTSS